MSNQIRSIVGRNLKVRGNTNPDPSWEHVGSWNGLPVYRERVPNWETVPQVDAEGKAVMITDNRTGVATRPRMVRVQREEEPWLFKDFQLVDLGNGMVKKNYHFKGEPVVREPSREERLESQVQELQQMVEKLAMGAVAEPVAAEPEEAPETEGEAAPPKRKRGRPRKQPVAEASTEESTS